MSFFGLKRRLIEGSIATSKAAKSDGRAWILAALIFCSMGIYAAPAEVISTTHTTSSAAPTSLISEAQGAKLPVLNVCGFDWAPYSYVKGGQTAGVLIDLLKRVELPYDIHFNFMPLPRCTAAVRQGQQDLMLYRSTPDDDLIMAEVVVQFHISGVVVTSASHHKRFTGLPQFSGESLGVLRGNPIYQSLKHHQGVDWQMQNSGKSMWQMLMRGRLDGAIGEYLSLTSLQVYRSGDVQFLTPPLHVTPVYMAAHKSKAAIIPLINARLHELLADGSVDRIYQQHRVEPFSVLQTMAHDFERSQRDKRSKASNLVETR